MSRRRVIALPTQDQRPPEVRLEAVVREMNQQRALRTFGRIRVSIDSGAQRPEPWLAAARALYERQVIGIDAFCYFAEIFTECLLDSDAGGDEELRRLSEGMRQVERKYGLEEDEYWRVSEAPPEWRALGDEWDVRARAIVAAALREAGLAEIADLHERQPDEFGRRSEKGHRDVLGEGLDR